MFLIQLPKLADLTTRHCFEYTLVIWCVLHQLINFWHRALAIALGQPLQKVGCDMIALVPFIPARLPMWGLKTGAKANPVCGVGAAQDEDTQCRQIYAPAIPSIRPPGQAPSPLYW